eukprot:107363-Chlamydomonas_euryale.AAC.7
MTWSSAPRGVGYLRCATQKIVCERYLGIAFDPGLRLRGALSHGLAAEEVEVIAFGKASTTVSVAVCAPGGCEVS